MRTLHESDNYIDNFLRREFRCERVEDELRRAQKPVVVDVGVNVGLTVRWWYSLNRECRVVGIDMLTEALDFTTAALGQIEGDLDWNPICSAVGERPEVKEIMVSDPLEGTTGLASSQGKDSRRIEIETLDRLVGKQGIGMIDLLKLDIEGWAGLALSGAEETLAKTRMVVVETHSEEETELTTERLHAAGMRLFRVYGRTMWWRRGAEKSGS